MPEVRGRGAGVQRFPEFRGIDEGPPPPESSLSRGSILCRFLRRVGRISRGYNPAIPARFKQGPRTPFTGKPPLSQKPGHAFPRRRRVYLRSPVCVHPTSTSYAGEDPENPAGFTSLGRPGAAWSDLSVRQAPSYSRDHSLGFQKRWALTHPPCPIRPPAPTLPW
jgi:hypothetical protein